MNRLFVRIFLSVWLGAALVGVSIAAVDAIAEVPVEAETEARIARRLLVSEATDLLEADPAERRARLADLADETGWEVAILDREGRPLVGSAAEVEGASETVLTRAELPGGEIAIARRPHRAAWARALATDSLALRTAIVVGVSALIALVVARHLSSPLARLRAAAHRVAQGDLQVRVAPTIGAAPSEVAELAEDFDRMVERIEELVARRDQLLYDVSHELGSPLARLRVALELARSRAGEPAAPLLDRIELEAERLGALTDEILTLRRLEDDASLVRGRVELSALLHDVARDAAFEASEAQTLVTLSAPEPLVVQADGVLIRRAFDNVIRNAIRHAPPGTEVEVTLERDRGHAAIVVRDRGPGVAEADRERIFEPFVQLDAARPGRGLGLAIAKRALALHGGTITADGAPGGGLRVTLRLPLEESSHALT